MYEFMIFFFDLTRNEHQTKAVRFFIFLFGKRKERSRVKFKVVEKKVNHIFYLIPSGFAFRCLPYFQLGARLSRFSALKSFYCGMMMYWAIKRTRVGTMFGNN